MATADVKCQDTARSKTGWLGTTCEPVLEEMDEENSRDYTVIAILIFLPWSQITEIILDE